MVSPVIGLTLRHHANGGPPVQMRNRAYFDALEDAGGAVMPIPVTRNREHLRALYERCDAVCLPGGPDVDPRLYGEQRCEDCGVDVDAELDSVELQLAEWALADRKPVLAICRGMQLLNVSLGGTLWQDLLQQREGSLTHQHEVSHRDILHEVQLVPGSLLHELAGEDVIEVNSRHHQAVRQPAAELRISATAGDGVIEGVEAPDGAFVVGVQCHPEDLYQRLEWSRRLFRGFIARSAGA